jgi:hypothetical protein
MKYNCELIRDLLPLYKDQACSSDSVAAVEEHLSECPACTNILNEMKSCDEAIDTPMIREKETVIADQARFFKRKGAIAGCIIGALFSIPVLICMLIDIVTGSGLSWSFIVLTAMCVPASLIVVPLLMKENKALWTLAAFTVSLLTLLGVCCLYGGGTWFFTAAASVLFALTLIFAPFAVHAKPIASRIGNNKGAAALGAITLTFLLMMICIGLFTRANGFAAYTIAYALPVFVYMWGMYALIRLPKWNGSLKAATCILFSALVYFFSDTFTLLVLGYGLRFPAFGFNFGDMVSANDTTNWIVLIVGTVLAAIFAIVGFTKNTKAGTDRRNTK